MKFTLSGLAVVLVVATACRTPPGERVVARIENREVRVAEFESYLDSVLQGAANSDIDEDLPADPERAAALREASSVESNHLRSRLFDAMIDEELLLHEADRLGIVVDDAQVREFAAGLHGQTPSAEPEQAGPTPEEIEQVRRTLRIQTLVQSALPPGERVAEGEVDAEIARLDGEDATLGRRLRLRSLVLPSKEIAATLHREIATGESTFDEAAVRQAFSVSQTQAADVVLDQLPPPVRSAVGRLKAGAVSPPTELHGETYLFQVESWLTADLAAESEKRMATRAKLAAERAAEAQKELLRQLRNRYEVEVFPKRLPFPYVPDEAGSPIQ